MYENKDSERNKSEEIRRVKRNKRLPPSIFPCGEKNKREGVGTSGNPSFHEHYVKTYDFCYLV